MPGQEDGELWLLEGKPPGSFPRTGSTHSLGCPCTLSPPPQTIHITSGYRKTNSKHSEEEEK